MTPKINAFTYITVNEAQYSVDQDRDHILKAQQPKQSV